MKRLLFSLFVILISHTFSSAQLVGGFSVAQDGHIYFQAANNTYYTITVKIIARSTDRNNSESWTIASGNGFYLGPTTPWRWYWKRGDIISVVYPNGQSQTWTCPQNDKIYNSPSFKTGNIGHCTECGLNHYAKYNCPKFVGTSSTCGRKGCGHSRQAHGYRQ